MSRPTLLQLRMGLANRSLSKNDAERLVDSVQSSLDQADHILRTQCASTLEQVVHTLTGEPAEFGGTLAEQIHTLREMVARLYADTGYAQPATAYPQKPTPPSLPGEVPARSLHRLPAPAHGLSVVPRRRTLGA